MSVKVICWLVFGGGIVVGCLVTMFFACLKIKGFRKSIKLKDSRIHILQGQIEQKDAIIKGFIEKAKEKTDETR